MKEIWVLTVRTSLPDMCYKRAELKMTVSAFEHFEDGRNEMREVIKSFAFSENPMFNGKGRITALDEYIDRMDETDKDKIYDDELTKAVLLEFHDSLLAVFNGEDTSLNMENGCSYCGDNFDFEYWSGRAAISLPFEPGINGCDPHISTNAFSMNEEKDYYIHIDDSLGQEYSSELYIDLKKVELN